MYLTSSALYCLKISFQQAAVSSIIRENVIEKYMMKSAFVLATVGLSISVFSMKKMFTSDHLDTKTISPI